MSNFEKIEAYTKGWMNEPERVAFEKELLDDAQLQQDYEDWLKADDILKRHIGNKEQTARLKEILEPLTRQHFGSEKPQKARVVSIKKYLVAAIAAAAIFIIYLFLPSGVDNYPSPNMPQALVRGAETTGNRGAQLFNEGKYEASLPLLKQRVLSDPTDATANFFYAVTLVKTKHYEEALILLSPLSDGVSAYKTDASFFAALSAYKLNRKGDALKYAEKVGEASPYYRPSQKIVQKCR